MSDHRDTIVVKEGGSSTGLLLGIVALIIVAAAGWYFLMGPGANTTGSDGSNDVNVNVTLPSVEPAAS